MFHGFVANFLNSIFIWLLILNVWKLFSQIINNVSYPELIIHSLFFKQNEINKTWFELRKSNSYSQKIWILLVF